MRHPIMPGAAGHPHHAQAAPGHARCAPELQGVPGAQNRKHLPVLLLTPPGNAAGRRPPAARAATGAARALTRSGPAASRPASTRSAVLRGRPAKQQPGQAPYRGGGTRARAARPSGPPRLQEQAVPLACPLSVVLDSLRKVLVDTHGLLPGRRCDSWRAEPPRAVVSVLPRWRRLAQAGRGALTCAGLFRRLSARQPAYSRFSLARSLTSDPVNTAC
jgi:hypothetical protein